MVNDCETRLAAAKPVLPDWSAAMVQVPAAIRVTEPPVIEQIAGVSELKVTVSELVAVAVGTLAIASPFKVWLLRLSKVMACGARLKVTVVDAELIWL
jgi:hypothetical protein